MRKALDCANYTPVPTPEQVACLVAQGYDTAIVGCAYGSVAHDQLAAFSAGGMSIEAYAWVSFGTDWQRRLDKALSVIDGLSITRLWLDCEEDPAGTNAPARITEALGYVRVARPDLAFGIYTGGWWWVPNTGDWQGMCHLPLWTAAYVKIPVKDGDKPPMYGGWTEAAIWQTQGSVEICGLNADDNVILEEEGMTDEVRAAIGEVLAQQAALGAKIDALQTSTEFLIKVVTNLAPRVAALEAKK